MEAGPSKEGSGGNKSKNRALPRRLESEILTSVAETKRTSKR